MNHHSEHSACEDISTTQRVVPDLIAALYKANTEVIQSSEGPAITVTRDPHLRLRRTLTPASPISGLKKVKDAQFMITGSTGKRINLTFSVLGHSFQMDAYVWGAEERDAKRRMIALHGVTPGISRTRWHKLGERLGAMESVRFVALDWHSIDRTDEPQTEFLTLLPKHIMSAISEDDMEDIVQMFPKESHGHVRKLFDEVKECPRSFEEGADVLRAVIEQGLGWGVDGKPFILGMKSWSGGVGLKLLAQASHEDGELKRNIAGAVIMHPGAFDKADADAVKYIPTIMCWAKDDQKVPYQLSSRFVAHPTVKLVAYEKGGHANFDGTNNLPNFDDDVVEWFRMNFLNS